MAMRREVDLRTENIVIRIGKENENERKNGIVNVIEREIEKGKEKEKIETKIRREEEADQEVGIASAKGDQPHHQRRDTIRNTPQGSLTIRDQRMSIRTITNLLILIPRVSINQFQRMAHIRTMENKRMKRMITL
jgi:hypothetical protein